MVENDNDRFDSTIFKVDQKIGENNLAARVQYRANTVENPFAGSPLPQFGRVNDDDRYLAGVDYTHMFSPTTLLELRFGFSGNNVVGVGAFSDQNIISELGMTNFLSDDDLQRYPGIDDFPLINPDNHANLGSANNLPILTDVRDTQWSIKMTNIRGNHNGEVRIQQQLRDLRPAGRQQRPGQLPLQGIPHGRLQFADVRELRQPDRRHVPGLAAQHPGPGRHQRAAVASGRDGRVLQR